MRTTRVAVALIVALALAGCSAQAPGADSEADRGTDAVDTPLTTGPITGWDGTELTMFGDMVSDAVAELCPPPWDLVSGSEITDLPLDDAVFHLCVFTSTPNTDNPDVVDEIAYRVEEGGLELALAYAAYPFTDEPDEECPGEFGGDVALMTTVIDGVTYGVNPGPAWCPTLQPENQALLDALVLTMVVRDTVSFAESLD